jgi:hypothetical protein
MGTKRLYILHDKIVFPQRNYKKKFTLTRKQGENLTFAPANPVNTLNIHLHSPKDGEKKF